LRKNRGHVTVSVVRPAIIASSLREPFPGWTDSLSAAGGISLLTGLGIIHYMRADGNNKFDITPVDLVTNQIIVATAYAPLTPKIMHMYNSGTSHQNPISMFEYK
jgi:fatty acyl-CoA reductase